MFFGYVLAHNAKQWETVGSVVFPLQMPMGIHNYGIFVGFYRNIHGLFTLDGSFCLGNFTLHGGIFQSCGYSARKL